MNKAAEACEFLKRSPGMTLSSVLGEVGGILQGHQFASLVGRLDNSAVSASGAKLAFKSKEEIAIQVRTIPVDEVIPESVPVLLKIDVQGWEYHVLKGATKLFSRKKGEAPFLIYEEDERLLQASNSTAKEIREFLHSVGYHHCTQHGTDAHCTKKD